MEPTIYALNSNLIKLVINKVGCCRTCCPTDAIPACFGSLAMDDGSAGYWSFAPVPDSYQTGAGFRIRAGPIIGDMTDMMHG